MCVSPSVCLSLYMRVCVGEAACGVFKGEIMSVWCVGKCLARLDIHQKNMAKTDAEKITFHFIQIKFFIAPVCACVCMYMCT